MKIFRSRLLVAAQAVPRHQEETYRQALITLRPGSRFSLIPRRRDKSSSEEAGR